MNKSKQKSNMYMHMQTIFHIYLFRRYFFEAYHTHSQKESRLEITSENEIIFCNLTEISKSYVMLYIILLQ